MDDPARLVAAGYDAVADAYAALEDDSSPWPRERWVADLVARLPAGAVVLDLGCGSGVPVARGLVEAGFDVTGVDVSAEQVRRARSTVPEATFRVADMRVLSLSEARFDAVVSLYAIEHVPRAEHAEIYRKIRHWLRPGGLLLLATEDADVEEAVGAWLGAPMFFSAAPAAETRRLVRAAGFDELEANAETQVEQGRAIPYLWLLARAR